MVGIIEAHGEIVNRGQVRRLITRIRPLTIRQRTELSLPDHGRYPAPPNNKAFATDLFLYTRDVMGVLKALGLIGGSAPAVSYPGRDAVLAAAGPMANAILQKQPNNPTSTITVTGPASVNGERD